MFQRLLGVEGQEVEGLNVSFILLFLVSLLMLFHNQSGGKMVHKTFAQMLFALRVYFRIQTFLHTLGIRESRGGLFEGPVKILLKVSLQLAIVFAGRSIDLLASLGIERG